MNSNSNYPLVSIIVPVYKTEKYLSECIESIVSQKYDNWELILVDDGSPDNSPQICEDYASKDKRIKVIHTLNAGASAARNTGIEIAKGEYVLFVDSDDYIADNLFERISEYIGNYDVIHWSYKKVTNNTSTDVILFDDIFFYEDDQCNEFYARLIGLFGKYLSRPELVDSLNPIWLKLYRLDIIIDHSIRFVDLREVGSSEDLLFNVEYFKYVKSIVCIPDCMYAYRRDNASSFTSSCKKDLINQWSYLYSQIQLVIMGDKLLERCFYNRKALGSIAILLNEYSRNSNIFFRYRNYKKALGAEMFIGVFDKLDLSPMPIHWKLFFVSIKNRHFIILTLLIEIIQFIRRHR